MHFQILQTTASFLLIVSMVISSSCYQYVRFISNPGPPHSRKLSNHREVRSFGHFSPIISPFPELWPEEVIWTHDDNIFEYTIDSHDDTLPSINHIGE